MDKKLYIQPQTEIIEAVLTQMLADSVTAPDQGIGYGGVATGEEDPDVKGESWTDIWE